MAMAYNISQPGNPVPEKIVMQKCAGYQKRYRQYVYIYAFIDMHICINIQREKLGTHGRVPEIYTNIYHLYMGYIMVLWSNMV